MLRIAANIQRSIISTAPSTLPLSLWLARARRGQHGRVIMRRHYRRRSGLSRLNHNRLAPQAALRCVADKKSPGTPRKEKNFRRADLCSIQSGRVLFRLAPNKGIAGCGRAQRRRSVLARTNRPVAGSVTGIVWPALIAFCMDRALHCPVTRKLGACAALPKARELFAEPSVSRNHRGAMHGIPATNSTRYNPCASVRWRPSPSWAHGGGRGLTAHFAAKSGCLPAWCHHSRPSGSGQQFSPSLFVHEAICRHRCLA